MAAPRVLSQFLLLLVVLLVVLFAVLLVLRLRDRMLDVLDVRRRLRLRGGEHAGHRGGVLRGGYDRARGPGPGADHDACTDRAHRAGRDRGPLTVLPARRPRPAAASAPGRFRPRAGATPRGVAVFPRPDADRLGGRRARPTMGGVAGASPATS